MIVSLSPKALAERQSQETTCMVFFSLMHEGELSQYNLMLWPGSKLQSKNYDHIQHPDHIQGPRHTTHQ